MKVGISTACFFGRLNTEKALMELGKMGVPYSEVFLSSFSEYTPKFANELIKIARDYAVEIVSVHALNTQFEPQLFSVNERQRSDAMDVCERVFDAAQLLGASLYVMHGPMAIKRNARHCRWDFARFAEVTDVLAGMAKSRGFALTWENVHWCQYYAPEFAQGLMSHCQSDNVFFTLDVKQAAQSGYPVADYIDDMGDRLVNVHLCDYVDDGGDIALRLPFEDGECDLIALRDALPVNGSVILEVYEHNYSDYAHLKRCYEKTRAFFQGAGDLTKQGKKP